MPRQIIDVESSRPAYRRRRIVTWSIVVLALLLVAAGCWLYHLAATGNLAH